MRVYINGELTVIETNLDFAVPYWEHRRRVRPDLRIRWVFGIG